MHEAFRDHLRTQLRQLDAEGLLKRERVLTSPQGAWIEADGKRVVNLCANNYLGLAGDPALVKAAQEALPRHGFGLSSVRFICGTQDVHKQLEERLARFLGTEDAILFASKQEEKRIASSNPRNAARRASSAVWTSCVPQMKRTEERPKP